MKEETLRQRRDGRIKEDYQKLYKEGFRSELIYEQLSNKYYLSKRTIEYILYKKP